MKMQPPVGEFELINTFFQSTSRRQCRDVVVHIGDDCAVLDVPMSMQLAVTTDTLVEDVHFLPNISAQDVAYKAVAVNLSDLAAMGATPRWISLALTLPKVDVTWLQAFSDSLFKILADYQVELIGGDTTSGKLSITITAQGLLPQGEGLFRHSAQVGDDIYVTGSLGDSRAGLDLLLAQRQDGEKHYTQDERYLLNRHLRPTPRLAIGQQLLGVANAAIDISDGLSGDLQHILQRSQVSAKIELDQLPLSDELLRFVKTEKSNSETALSYALGGGEDYELCFTAPPMQAKKIQQIAQKSGVSICKIGEIIATEASPTIHYSQHDHSVPDNWQAGFDHFKSFTQS